jgi:type II secretory pathway pseudopilin PulG
MTLRSWSAGVGARLRHDERGFTLLETVIAVTVVFGALLALAYTATIGFGYQSLARQRMTATQVANRIMEQVRGLAYSKVQAGLADADLSGDPNIVACSEPTGIVFRFLSCLPVPSGSPVGAGERIVHSPISCPASNPDCVAPLVRHRGTMTANGITYSWSVYVTNDCPTLGSGCTKVAPYRVTVLVTWTGGRAYPTKLVRIQSLFYSPAGCRSTTTHPFAAPCQPFFFATARAPVGSVSVSGSIAGLSFSSGELLTIGVESSLQQEQLSQAQGSYTATGVVVRDAGGERVAGVTSEVTTASDADPGSTTPPYSSSTLTPPTGLSTVSSASGNVEISFTSPAGDTARSDSTVAAGGTYVCPPPTDTAETDGKPCAGSRAQQGGTAPTDAAPLTAALRLDGFASGLGSATLARVGNQNNGPAKTFVNRVIYATSTATCSPVNGADGCVDIQSVRSFGTIGLGGLPSGMAAPIGWNGYWLRIVGYTDSGRATVGRAALSSASTGPAVSAPSTSLSGTLSYWNGTQYVSLPVNDPRIPSALDAFAVTGGTPFSLTQTVGGKTVTVTIGTVAGASAQASASTSTTVSGTGNLSRTEAIAQVTPPRVTLVYRVAVDGEPAVDLRIELNLKTLEARGVYAPAPAPGS